MVDLAGLEIEGTSLGGINTCIEVPQWRLAFDMGCTARSSLRYPTVLFTHGHIDHMAAAPWHAAMRSLQGMKAPLYVVPQHNAEAFESLFEAWSRLDCSQLEHELVSIGPGEEVALPKSLSARAFRSPHRVPCQGYIIYSNKQQLRAQYRGLPKDELQRLKVQEGVEISENIQLPELAFTGDTTIEVIERVPELRTVKRLIIEVTFLDERVSAEDSRSKGHVHLDDVLERQDLFENEALLFTHFSSRYRKDEILSILDRKLPSSLRERVSALV